MAESLSIAFTRRRALLASVSLAFGLGGGLPVWAGRDVSLGRGARITADFDPIAAIWLGYDAGHEAFTADLAEALWPHVPIRMLVRDAEAEGLARAVLRSRGLDADKLRFVYDTRAPFFVRDAVVFGLDGERQPFVVDFRWTYYGWSNWCRRTFRGSQPRPESCARADGLDTGSLDRRLGDVLGLATFSSALAIEGGGVEVNGQGLLIANAELWSSRNRNMSRAAMEREMLRLPGIRKVIWLPKGLAHDTLHRGTITGAYVGWGTGGHTDEFVRFADARTVLLAWVDEAEAASHPVARINAQRMQANFDILSASLDADGRPLRVLKVPLPRTIERPVVLSADADTAYSNQWTAAVFPAREGRREGDTVMQVATSSYLNHVVANDIVLLPDYVAHGTPPERQQQVKALYEEAFAGRKVRFIDTVNANWVGGGAHCATLTEPLGRA
jgi:agmatine deiminase